MKVELSRTDDYIFLIEPENDLEECALKYLGNRPPEQIFIDVSYIGSFTHKDAELKRQVKSEIIKEMHEAKQKREE